MGTAITVISVLHQDTVILFVHTDGVGDKERLTGMVVEGGIKVVDGTETITAQSKRVGTETQTVLSDIESVLAVVRSVGIGVGNNHLREGNTVEERTLLGTVLVADVVENKTLTVVHGDAQVPLLPVNFIALHSERDTLRLLDDDGLDILAVVVFSNEFRQEVVLLERDGGASELGISGSDAFNGDNLHLTKIYLFVCVY